MTNINDAINNVEDEEITTPDAAAPGAAAKEEPNAEPAKSISLDDALAQAFEKHAKPEGDKPAAKAKAALPNTPAVEQTPGKVVDPITGRESEPMKPPAGWTPVLREKWSSIDPTVQKFIRDQEVHNSKFLQEVSVERKMAGEFKDIVAPYEAQLRGFNVSAPELTKSLFTQWHAMHTGTPQQKAEMFHTLIDFFKPDIGHMVALSQGQRPQQQPVQQVPDVDSLVEQKFVAREKAQQEQAVASDIARFSADPKNEYFADVKDQMGRILNAELVDAPTMPELLKKAYDLACSNHPEISQLLAQRKTAAPTAPVKKAAPVASVKPSLGTGEKSKAPARKMTLDEAVNAAFNAHAA